MEFNENNFRLDGKVALITGAGRGIGAKCAEALSKAGAKVMVTDILEEEGNALAAKLKDSGMNAAFYPIDVTKEEQWISAIESTVQNFGGLHILVNNAGVESMNLIENVTLEEWRRVMRVNADGVFLGTKHAILAMKPGGKSGEGGSIINMASVGSMVALYGAVNYCASKGAVRLLSKVAAVECGKLGYGIRVNSIHPGVILTELVKTGFTHSAERGLFASKADAQAMYENLHPIGRLGDPKDIANAVLYLASDASSFVTGSELVVDGGFLAQ